MSVLSGAIGLSRGIFEAAYGRTKCAELLFALDKKAVLRHWLERMEPHRVAGD